MSISAQNGQKRVAVSKAGPDEKYKLYIKALKDVNPEIEYVDLSEMSINDALKEMETCQGLVVSGGPDVHPSLYGKEKDAGRCGPFDRKRDGLDISLLKSALNRKIPILAICRGAQILNVIEGGTLIVDIPSDYPGMVSHRLLNEEGAKHTIIIEKNSILYNLIDTVKCTVNSYHHQAIDRLAPSFQVIARADDKITEAYTWKDPVNKSFLIAVQWHPERIIKEDILSKKVIGMFLAEVVKQ